MECDTLGCYENAETKITINGFSIVLCSECTKREQVRVEHWRDVPGAVVIEPAP